MTDQARGKVLGLEELKGAVVQAEDDPEPAFIHTYNPDFPTDTSADAGEVFGLFPFLAATARAGEAFDARNKRVDLFMGIVEEHGPAIQRSIKNFFDEDWLSFKESVKELKPDAWPLELDIDRQRTLFHVLERTLGPVFSSEGHAALVSTMTDELVSLAKKDEPALEALLVELVNSGLLERSRRELVQITARFLEMTEVFRPVIREWNPEDPAYDLPSELAVHGPRPFHELKTFYVDAYEAVMRSLTLVMSFANLAIRGDFSAFPIHPTLGKRYAPVSLTDFHDRSNAPKLDYLPELPWLARWLLPALNPKLRNAIGHNSAEYDVKSGLISYPINGKGAMGSISYGAFLIALIRLIRAGHQMSHFCKILYVNYYFRHSALHDEAKRPCDGAT